MTPTDLEQIYELLARRIDEVDEDAAQVFLARLALLMAQRIGDPDIVRACIDAAAQEPHEAM